MEEQQQFLQVATQASGVCAKCKGPAAALKGYLLRLGIQITPSGDLLFVSGVVLNIITTPFSVLRNHIRDEWLRDLPLLTSERASVRNAPMINRRITQQTLAKFHPTQRAALLREVCNTFQLQSQKKHWTGEDTDTCPHCTGIDSRRHRATQCEALRDAYLGHEKVIQEMQDLHDIHFDLPVIFRSPLHDVIIQCHYNPAPTVFVQNTVEIIDRHLQHGHRPVFFSDGSCYGSTTPGMSLAAWALVYGTATTAEEVRNIECLGLNPQNLSSSFLMVAVDRCHGEQTIDRAELWALLKLHERWKKSTLITDSEYARASWLLVQQVQSEQQLIFRPNADLLVRLRRAQADADHEVIKVQSHTLDGTTVNKAQQSYYHSLGNMVADTAAKRANELLAHDMVKHWRTEHAELQQQQTMRQAHYRLLLDVQPLRARLEHNSRATRSMQMMLPPQDNPHLTLAEQLENWNPEPTSSFALHWPENLSLKSPWGEEIMVEIIQWWNDLRWPNQVNSDINKAGVSWAELTMDFLQDRHVSIPTRHPYSEDKVFQKDLLQLKQSGVGFYHVVKNFFYMVAWLDRRLQGRVFEGLTRGKVRSLQRQGSTNKHNGVIPRPRLTNQRAVIRAISEYREASVERFSGLIHWPWTDAFWRNLRIGA